MKIPKLAVMTALCLLLAGCNFPGITPEPTESPNPTTAPEQIPTEPSAGPALTDIMTPDLWFLACADGDLELTAAFEEHPAGIESVVAHYRWNGGIRGDSSDWSEAQLTSLGVASGQETFQLILTGVGSEAHNLFGDESGAFEYQLTATATDGGVTQWPPNNESYFLPVDPCSDVHFIVEQYGVSTDTAGYGPGCSPTEETFEIILRGVSRVEETWLEYSFAVQGADPQVLPDEIVADLEGPTPVPSNPGAVSYTYTIDLNTDAAAALNGQNGFMYWNGYVRTDDGMVFEYPEGGPPFVTVEACSN